MKDHNRHFFDAQTCDRCHGPLLARTMSRFNTDTICLPCQTKEKAHPDYPKAAAAELEAVKQGNYNFGGIGKPSDL